MAATAINITDLSQEFLRLVITDETGEVQTNDIKKSNMTTTVSGDVVIVKWHHYGVEKNAQFRVLDYTVVEYPVVTNAQELADQLSYLSGAVDHLRFSRHLLYIG